MVVPYIPVIHRLVTKKFRFRDSDERCMVFK